MESFKEFYSAINEDGALDKFKDVVSKSQNILKLKEVLDNIDWDKKVDIDRIKDYGGFYGEDYEYHKISISSDGSSAKIDATYSWNTSDFNSSWDEKRVKFQINI